MPSDSFHVHGPHDHELEHAAAHGTTDRFSGRIAVTTAILATIGALFSYEGGATQAAAQLAKNDAAIRKTEAANQWNYYQAKSNKQNLAELASVLVAPDRQESYRSEASRYKGEKADIQQAAEKLEAESKTLRPAVRRLDAPASSLGAGHDLPADRHRVVGHRAADAPRLAAVGRLRRRRLRRGAGAARSLPSLNPPAGRRWRAGTPSDPDHLPVHPMTTTLFTPIELGRCTLRNRSRSNRPRRANPRPPARYR